MDDEARRLFHTLTNELHANTQAVGRLAGDVGRLGERLLTLEVRVGDMRGQLDSVPETAEDTAKHEVERLKLELARQELEERKASSRVRADRRWQLLIQAGALLLASGLGGAIAHIWHVLGK